MAKFQKGNKLGGRTLGSKNKNTQQIRDAYQKLIEDCLPDLKKDLAKLEPKDRLKMIIDLSSFVVPKLRQIDPPSETLPMGIPVINFTKDNKPFDIRDIYNVVKETKNH